MIQHTITLPKNLYDAVHQQALSEQKTPDALVEEWVSARLEQTTMNGAFAAFQQEVAAFEAMKSALIKSHAGQYVAIHRGEVVATGVDKLALLHRVREEFGDVVCYIEKVAVNSPKVVRMPSLRVSRQ